MSPRAWGAIKEGSRGSNGAVSSAPGRRGQNGTQLGRVSGLAKCHVYVAVANHLCGRKKSHTKSDDFHGFERVTLRL